MDVSMVKEKADRELELMQGCLPAVDDLPVERDSLYSELIKLSKILHSTANRLAGYAGYLKSVKE